MVLTDLGQAELDAAMEIIRTNLGRQARKGAITESSGRRRWAGIAPAVGLDALKDVDMVIEAVFEDEAVKKSIFTALRGELPEHTIICTNSSSLPVTRLAASTDRPGKFMGMHFMNPVPMMELVELVRGIATEEKTYETARKVTERMGKTEAMAEGLPGLHREPHPHADVNEAIYALYEGVGNREGHRHGDEARRSSPHGGRWSLPISSASTPASRSCRRFMKASRTASTGPAPCSQNMSRRAGSAARPARLLRLLHGHTGSDSLTRAGPSLTGSQQAAAAARR